MIIYILLQTDILLSHVSSYCQYIKRNYSLKLNIYHTYILRCQIAILTHLTNIVRAIKINWGLTSLQVISLQVITDDLGLHTHVSKIEGVDRGELVAKKGPHRRILVILTRFQNLGLTFTRSTKDWHQWRQKYRHCFKNTHMHRHTQNILSL